MTGEVTLVYSLYADRAAAEAAARDAVAQRLAACANILAPGTSVYIWQGEAMDEAEIPVLFKTAPARRDALLAWLEASHPYDLPAILHWPVGATAAYAHWVESMTVS